MKKLIPILTFSVLSLGALVGCNNTATSSSFSSSSAQESSISESVTSTSSAEESSQSTSEASSSTSESISESISSSSSSATVVASDPVLTITGEKTYTVNAGEDLTLPTASAKDYLNNDLTSSIEVEDLAESGTIKGNVFNAKIAGEHKLSYYVEDSDGRFAETEIIVNVVPAHEETFDVTDKNDPALMAEYKEVRENFAKGRKSPIGAMTDGNNAVTMTSTEEAIEGNSLIIDANKTAGSAANCVFLNSFNDYFKRGLSATYSVSFKYKIIEGSDNFGDFYFGLSWDGFDGLNNSFVGSKKEIGQVYEYTCTFPGAVVPETGNAYFRFFKLSGATSATRIAVDSFTFQTKELAQVTTVVPTADQLQEENGFTWNFSDKAATSTNGEIVIVDKLDDAEAVAAMKASDKFSANALRLTNADGHLFDGLTKDNMIVSKMLTIDITYYAINDTGFNLIMMGTSGNPTLQITNTAEGKIHTVHCEVKVLSGFYQLNIYGASNPNFDILIGSMTAKLTDAAPVPEDQTPNGHKVGDNWDISSRQWGNQDKNGIATAAFDDYAPAIENEKMGTAPTKLTVNGGNLNMEWFQANGKMEIDQTYEITLTYYVKEYAEGPRFMYNFDNNVFLDIGPTTVGFHESTIPWKATRTVDFFSFFFPDANSVATIYIAKVNVKLTEIAK